MSEYISSGAILGSIIGLFLLVVGIFHNKNRHEKSRNVGGLPFLADIILLLPWYIIKILLILLGISLIILPIISL
ncbi:hypothetical protein [Bacillus cihuensis]|uniref:hypothetical protein n=1 Tax=Bacillus cihuensis TaxID=1208599 RepID=UPI00041A9DB4|nr:hypothetical protein [Bacillus cihuensis]